MCISRQTLLESYSCRNYLSNANDGDENRSDGKYWFGLINAFLLLSGELWYLRYFHFSSVTFNLRRDIDFSWGWTLSYWYNADETLIRWDLNYADMPGSEMSSPDGSRCNRCILKRNFISRACSREDKRVNVSQSLTSSVEPFIFCGKK